MKANLASSETDNQRLMDLILFCGIGDGYISKLDPIRNCNLTISHSTNQLDYALWKVDLLEKHGLKFGDAYFRKDKNEVSFRSQRHELCTIIRKRLYQESKKVITNRILRRIDDLGFAIWFCDDGSYSINKAKWRKQSYNINNRPDYKIQQFKLSTQCFSYDENVKIKDYLNKRFDLSWVITKDRNYDMLYLNGIEQMERLKEILLPVVPDCMKYKINHPTSFIKYEYQKRLNEVAPLFEGDATVQI